jgi:hypothetical protein
MRIASLDAPSCTARRSTADRILSSAKTSVALRGRNLYREPLDARKGWFSILEALFRLIRRQAEETTTIESRHCSELLATLTPMEPIGIDPVTKAQRSEHAQSKDRSKRTESGEVVHSFTTLMRELAL